MLRANGTLPLIHSRDRGTSILVVKNGRSQKQQTECASWLLGIEFLEAFGTEAGPIIEMHCSCFYPETRHLNATGFTSDFGHGLSVSIACFIV